MADYISCDNSAITLEQALGAVMTKTTAGDKAVRIMLVEACAEDAIDCSNSSIKLEDLLKSAIGISTECSKPALRLGFTKEALATHLGLAFVDNAAALAALGGTGFQYYDTTANAWAKTV